MCPPKGAPNVLIILLDDVDFSATSAYGGPRHRVRDVDIPPSPESISSWHFIGWTQQEA
jgi:arylsulfatase A-like enzyme